MVPMEILALKHDVGNHGKHTETDTFLEHFQLYKIEGTAVALKAQAVGGDVTTAGFR